MTWVIFTAEIGTAPAFSTEILGYIHASETPLVMRGYFGDTLTVIYDEGEGLGELENDLLQYLKDYGENEGWSQDVLERAARNAVEAVETFGGASIAFVKTAVALGKIKSNLPRRVPEVEAVGHPEDRPLPGQLYIRRLSMGSKLPVRGSKEAAGLDVFAAEDRSIGPHECVTVGTGLAFDIPPGYFIQVNPRTGLAVHNGIGVLAGVVDSDYRGELSVILYNVLGNRYDVKCGDRIAQLVVLPCAVFHPHPRNPCRPPVPEGWVLIGKQALSETRRGENRFGSTGVSGEPGGE